MANFFKILSIFIVVLFATLIFAETDYDVEDVFVPPDCESVATIGDHLLLEYAVQFSNGTAGASLKKPSQLFHLVLNNKDDLPITSSLKGMCKNGVRRISWEEASYVNLLPLFVKDPDVDDADVGVSIDVTITSITTAAEYEIFSSLRQGNMTHVLDLIDQHVGVNAVDEWGQTPLMIAVQMNRIDIVAALLNTRKPKVDVNAAKPSGYTALFYAVEKSNPSLVSALLRRGADPNVMVLQEGGRGNTPLHFACLLEKYKLAEILLEFGAHPNPVNQYGKTPLQLVPADAVRSTKLFFKKMFEDAEKKLRNVANVEKKDTLLTQSMMNGGRTDL